MCSHTLYVRSSNVFIEGPAADWVTITPMFFCRLNITVVSISSVKIIMLELTDIRCTICNSLNITIQVFVKRDRRRRGIEVGK